MKTPPSFSRILSASILLLMTIAFTPTHAASSAPEPKGKPPIEAGTWLPLHPSAPKDPRPEVWEDKERITDVFNPQIQFYFPENWKPTDRRPLLCIFPGGGYSIEAIIKEGTQIAEWANSMGMVAAIVKYRVSKSDASTGRFPGPLLDARRAIRLARSQSKKLGIHPGKIGVIGFSAGGHLAAMATTLWNNSLPQEKNAPLLSISARPDFSMLIYPVITMYPPFVHGGSRHAIVGATPSENELRLCSAEKNVTQKTPPVFLVHAKDDPVSFQNSELMEKACRQHSVPVTKMLYANGGHGYGLIKQGTATDEWPVDAQKWLKTQQIIPSGQKR